jgi:Family of unknown function (DUF6134)
MSTDFSTFMAVAETKRRSRVFVVAVALMMTTAATETETREFRVLVDGKPAGTYKMTIDNRPDGSIVQSGQADVSLQVLLRKVTYTYRGTETWKDARLVKLDTSTNDDGKKYQVLAGPDGNGLRVTVNGKAHTAPANVWTTTYWHLPADGRQGDITRIDTDNGKVLSGKIQNVGREKITAAGQSITATRYRITGNAPTELWFDEASRLVRQEAVEEGHKTVLELVKITR